MLQKNNIKIKPLSIGVYVGLDFVGDGLINLPFIRSLRQVFPQAKITWIAGTHKSEFKRSLAPLVKGLLNEVIEEAEDKINEAVEEVLPDFNSELKNKLKESHHICPHMGKEANMLTCIQYPPHNTAYLVSLCCDGCIREIQHNFKQPQSQHKYKFVKEGNDYYFHGKVGKQQVLPCTPYHIIKMKEITGYRIA